MSQERDDQLGGPETSDLLEMATPDVDRSVQCSDCGRVIDDSPDESARTPCPSCESSRRTFHESVVEGLRLGRKFCVKVKDPAIIGKRKTKIELLEGDELSHKLGGRIKKIRVIDRANDRYVETVTDPGAGEVIHHCDEPLSDHFGHGSDK